MKKQKKIQAVLITLLVSLNVMVPTEAAQTRAVMVTPSLSITSNKATCSARVVPDTTSDTVSLTVKLWKGNQCIKTWKDSGTGVVSFTQTATVTKGYTYKLTVSAVVKGITQPTVTVSKTY